MKGEMLECGNNNLNNNNNNGVDGISDVSDADEPHKVSVRF